MYAKKVLLKEYLRNLYFATGITSGDLMNGVFKENDKYVTETIITHKKSELKLIKKEVSLT